MYSTLLSQSYFSPVFCSRTGFLPSSPLGFKNPEAQSAAGPAAS